MLTEKEINLIEEKLGYKFNNKELLKIAFTHSSVANLLNQKSNERLEFLGDSILNFTTTEFLFNNFQQNEGYLSKAKSYLVSAKYLSIYIKSIGVINYLHCKTFNPTNNENVMGDLFEAILGAIYLDCKDIDYCKKFIIDRLQFNNQTLDTIYDEMQDYKTLLQEYVQGKHFKQLEYKVLEKSGPAHNPEFTIACLIDGEIMGKAKSNNKKTAENLSAKMAYQKMVDKN